MKSFFRGRGQRGHSADLLYRTSGSSFLPNKIQVFFFLIFTLEDNLQSVYNYFNNQILYFHNGLKNNTNHVLRKEPIGNSSNINLIGLYTIYARVKCVRNNLYFFPYLKPSHSNIFCVALTKNTFLY